MNNDFPYADCQLELHYKVIESIVKYTNCKNYLELGVQEGKCFETILPHVKRAIGVDIKDIRKKKLGEFYEISTDKFFDFFKDTMDIIFIDADHSFESVKKDFENSLKILNKYGIIFLHDTDPSRKIFLEPGYCNDCYKIVDYIKQNHPELDIVTLPLTIAGLSIVMRKDDRRVLQFI